MVLGFLFNVSSSGYYILLMCMMHVAIMHGAVMLGNVREFQCCSLYHRQLTLSGVYRHQAVLGILEF